MKLKTMRTDTRIVIWVIASTLFLVYWRIAILPVFLSVEKLKVIEAQNVTLIQVIFVFTFLMFLAVVSRKTLENIFGKGLLK